MEGGGEEQQSSSNVWNTNLLRMWTRQFSVEKVEWRLINKRVEFRQCTLKQDIPETEFVAGDVIYKISLVFHDDGWHARIYKTAEDSRMHRAVHVTFLATWSGTAR